MGNSSMAPRMAVINVVGLCRRLIGEHTPFLREYASLKQNALVSVRPVLPAVTSTMQATYLTGKLPGEHGIVGNYWYDREYGEHRAWKQSDHLVGGPKIWETLRDQFAGYSCARVFWWNNMYSSVDYSITPRPIYRADGKKVFDIQTWPMNLRDEIKADLGEFPFPSFWGPAAGLPSSSWIAEAAKWYEKRFLPNLNLVYLPHLDYNLQRLGPEDSAVHDDIRQIDAIVEDLVEFFGKRGVKTVIVSEYGITPVDRPIHINREFRKKGWIVCRDELGSDQIDPGNCKALAIPDHQLAHIYVNDKSLLGPVTETVKSMPGVAQIFVGDGIAKAGLAHERSGDLVAVSDERSWFTYYYWLEDNRAPDFARTVDIHRKPGYDPAELFLDPAIRFPKLKIGAKLIGKKLGFRTLMDVIPPHGNLVRGSHGCIPESEMDFPVVLGNFASVENGALIEATDVYHLLLQKAGAFQS